jgi:hypothetical protein
MGLPTNPVYEIALSNGAVDYVSSDTVNEIAELIGKIETAEAKLDLIRKPDEEIVRGLAQLFECETPFSCQEPSFDALTCPCAIHTKAVLTAVHEHLEKSSE